MSDYFALLDEPRRPWLDPELLRAKFLARSGQVHPDHTHDASEPRKDAASRDYAELNAAFNCLRDPKQRLAHLLHLELGAKPKDLQEMPADLAEMFMEVAQLCRQADAFLTEKSRATSPLLQVQLFERGQECVEKLTALQMRLTTRRESLARDLEALDAQWNATRTEATAHHEVLEQLEKLYRLLSFFERWNGQVQERLVGLAI